MRDDVVALRQRTTNFALRVVKMYSALPHSRVAQSMGYQALRSGTSVGGQYREACRARSNAELVSKLESVLQELDETSYWLELLVDSEVVTQKRLAGLRIEAETLMAMLVAAVKNIKSRHGKR